MFEFNNRTKVKEKLDGLRSFRKASLQIETKTILRYNVSATLTVFSSGFLLLACMVSRFNRVLTL